MVPGHPDGVVTVHLGFGRRAEAGRVGAGVGFDAYQLRTSDAPLFICAARRLTKVPGTYDLCVTKVHNIEHRGSFAQHDLEKPLRIKRASTRWPVMRRWSGRSSAMPRLRRSKKNPDFAHEGASGTLIDKVGYCPQGERSARR